MLHVVTGAPCSGKTTYALAHRADGAIVIDLDALTAALGGEYHGRGGKVREVARAARDAAIDAAVANGVDAWVVHSMPSKAHRAFYDRVGAEYHCLDPGIETCKRRARESKRPSWTVAAIDSWYATRGGGHEPSAPEASRRW